MIKYIIHMTLLIMVTPV